MRFKAIGLIQDEHRSLAAVIQAAEFLVRKYIRDNKAPDFKLLHAMLYYVRELFSRIARLTPAPMGLGDPDA